MDIITTGPWILLGGGVTAVLGAVIGTFKGITAKALGMMWVFGVLLSGVGVYGPAFLGPYTEFLNSMSAMVTTPSTSTYAAVFEKVGTGDFPPEFQEIALAYVLDRPVDDMDSLLKNAIDGSTDRAGRDALIETQTSLRGKVAVAEHLAKELTTSGATMERVEQYEPATKSLVARELTKLPDAQLRRLNVDPAKLRELARPRPTRVLQKKP